MAGTLPTWKPTGLFYIYCVPGEVRSLELGLWARDERICPWSFFFKPLLPIHLLSPS